MVRYIREEEIIAQELKKTRRGVADVQRPTGTERRRTADKADQLEAAQVELTDRLEQAEEDLSGQNQRIEEAEQKAEDAFFNADQARLDAAAALAAAESAAGPNAVVDPGMEHPSMWEDRLSTAGARFSIVESGARSGMHALQAVEGSEDGVLTLGSMPVKVGTVIRFVVWVNTPTGMGPSERPILEFYDQNGTLVRSINMPVSAVSGAWAQWSTSTTIATNESSITNMEARLRVRHTATRTVLFDDFEIVDYTQAQELALAVSGSIQGKPSLFYRSDAPTTGTYASVGSTWFQTDADGNIIAQFQQTAATVGNPPVLGNVWEQAEITSEAIANLDVGKLRVGDGEIDQLVVQNIAAQAGQYIELDVSQLVASEAVLDEAVANKIWSDSTVTRLLTAQDIIAGDAIITGTITADKLAANALTVGMLDVGSISPNVATPLTAANWKASGSKTDMTAPLPTTGSAEFITVDGEPVARVKGHQNTHQGVFLHQLADIDVDGNAAINIAFSSRSAEPRTGIGRFSYLVYCTLIRNGVAVETASVWNSSRQFMDGYWRGAEGFASLPFSTQVGDRLHLVLEAEGATYPVDIRQLQVNVTPTSVFIDSRSVRSNSVRANVVNARTARAETAYISDAFIDKVAVDQGGRVFWYEPPPEDLEPGQGWIGGSEALYYEDVVALKALLTSTVTNWNNAVTTGFYTSGSSASNAPQSSFAMMGIVVATSAGYVWQEVREISNGHNSPWYRYRSSGGVWTAWRKSGPATGTYTAGTNIAAGEFFDQVVTFPAGRFTSAPKVVAGTNQVRVLAACTSKSATQATIRVYNVSSGTAGGTCTVDWTATA